MSQRHVRRMVLAGHVFGEQKTSTEKVSTSRIAPCVGTLSVHEPNVLVDPASRVVCLQPRGTDPKVESHAQADRVETEARER